MSSNAWAFGRESTADGRGLLLGNPHFPWKGTNRFWEMHVTIPGSLDVMGVAIGNFPVVVIGFNKDVAWSHTVSTGKRFTLHQLKLVDDDPTSYFVDGRAEKMTMRNIAGVTLWSTRYGPLIRAPRWPDGTPPGGFNICIRGFVLFICGRMFKCSFAREDKIVQSEAFVRELQLRAVPESLEKDTCESRVV